MGSIIRSVRGWFSRAGQNAGSIVPRGRDFTRHLICADSSQQKFIESRMLQRFNGYINAKGNGARKVVGHWLVASSGLVFGIVVLGGLTRLTESGLSMVDWHLIHFRAPSSIEEWQAYFEKYKEFPEYKLQNQGMTLEEFKRIYWFEHAHRVYGRLLGLFVTLPALFFIARKWASPKMCKLLFGCTALVGFQVLQREWAFT